MKPSTKTYAELSAEADARLAVRQAKETIEREKRRSMRHGLAMRALMGLIGFFKAEKPEDPIAPPKRYSRRQVKRVNRKRQARTSRMANRVH